MLTTPHQLLTGRPKKDEYSDSRWIERSRQFRSGNRHCQSCRRSNVPLQTHHVNYTKGRHLWEYDDADLACLCESCHELITEVMREFRRSAAHCNASNLARIQLQLSHLLKTKGDQWLMIQLSRLTDR